MKGLSTTILIVVTAVVILVAALVLLTIFSQGIQNVTTITQGQALCQASAQVTGCLSGTWSAPATWTTPTVRVAGGSPQSCESLFTLCTCNGPALTCTSK